MTDYPVITNLTLLQGSTFNPVLTAYDGPDPAIANKIDWREHAEFWGAEAIGLGFRLMGVVQKVPTSGNTGTR